MVESVRAGVAAETAAAGKVSGVLESLIEEVARSAHLILINLFSRIPAKSGGGGGKGKSYIVKKISGGGGGHGGGGSKEGKTYIITKVRGGGIKHKFHHLFSSLKG